MKPLIEFSDIKRYDTLPESAVEMPISWDLASDETGDYGVRTRYAYDSKTDTFYLISQESFELKETK